MIVVKQIKGFVDSKELSFIGTGKKGDGRSKGRDLVPRIPR